MKNKILLGVLIIIVIITGSLLIKNLNKNTEEDSLQRIIEKGSLILGLDDSFPPMGFRNENNEIVGFDIDVAKEVAKSLITDKKLEHGEVVQFTLNKFPALSFVHT